jgi:hypothetical protein
VKLALQAAAPSPHEPAGLFGWVDTGVDTDALSQRMLDEGYLLAPGACSTPAPAQHPDAHQLCDDAGRSSGSSERFSWRRGKAPVNSGASY